MLTGKVDTTRNTLGGMTGVLWVNAWFLGPAYGLSQGFEQWDSRAGDSGDRLLRDGFMALSAAFGSAPILACSFV